MTTFRFIFTSALIVAGLGFSGLAHAQTAIKGYTNAEGQWVAVDRDITSQSIQSADKAATVATQNTGSDYNSNGGGVAGGALGQTATSALNNLGDMAINTVTDYSDMNTNQLQSALSISNANMDKYQSQMTSLTQSSVQAAADAATFKAIAADADDEVDSQQAALNSVQTNYNIAKTVLASDQAALSAARNSGAPAATITALTNQVAADQNDVANLNTAIKARSADLSQAQQDANDADVQASLAANDLANYTQSMAVYQTKLMAEAARNVALSAALGVSSAYSALANQASLAANNNGFGVTPSRSGGGIIGDDLTSYSSSNFGNGMKYSSGTGGTTNTTTGITTSAPGNCNTSTLGGMICQTIDSTKHVPGLITGFAYMAGLICGFLGVIKLKEHVEQGSGHVPGWDPLKRFIACGAFLSLPYVADVVMKTVRGDTANEASISGFSSTSAAGGGLDAMIIRLVGDTLKWITLGTGVVGWFAGLIFVFIGISRLMKSEREGPNGPTGIGTITTFLIAGALFSMSSIIAAINGTVFGAGKIKTSGVLKYTDGLDATAITHVNGVISAVIGFAIIVGWISVARGLFMVRSVSEGNSQASMMAAITHLIGGVLAINLGSVITAVQNTLGITTYGFTFN